MGTFIAMGVSLLMEALLEKKEVIKYADKFAKVFVRIERQAESTPPLAAAIERARQKS